MKTMSNQDIVFVEVFADLVNRERKGQATPDEIVYLKSHLAEWRATASLDLEKALKHIGYLELEMQEDVYHDKTFELQRKIAKAKIFARAVQSSFTRINLYRKQQAVEREEKRREAKQEAKQEKYNTEKSVHQQKMKVSYCAGFEGALHCIEHLVRGGLTTEDAYSICSTYHTAELREWSLSTELTEPRPSLPCKDKHQEEQVS